MARLDPKERKQQILQAAIKLAEKEGFNSIRRDGVAFAADVSNGLINQYFGTIGQLKRAVMRAAIKLENLEILSQGLIVKDKTALKAPGQLREKAYHHLIG